jgi:hypothetical protein
MSQSEIAVLIVIVLVTGKFTLYSTLRMAAKASADTLSGGVLHELAITTGEVLLICEAGL